MTVSVLLVSNSTGVTGVALMLPAEAVFLTPEQARVIALKLLDSAVRVDLGAKPDVAYQVPG